jgi:CDP-diacylglycerol--glycerol-3-phosphate 3-phosphatidyltransferase
MLRHSPLGVRYIRLIEGYPLKLLIRTGLKPNAVSSLAFSSGLMAGVLLAVSPFWGGWATLASGLLDTLDGALARRQNRQSPQGAFLDSVLDRYVDGFLLLGLAVYFFLERPAALYPIFFLVWLGLLGAFLVSYTKARAESLGFPCEVGIFERGERILILGLGCILEGILALVLKEDWQVFKNSLLILTLLIYTAGSHLTVFQRIRHTLRQSP